jgi:hypothetical protein
VAKKYLIAFAAFLLNISASNGQRLFRERWVCPSASDTLALGSSYVFFSDMNACGKSGQCYCFFISPKNLERILYIVTCKNPEVVLILGKTKTMSRKRVIAGKSSRYKKLVFAIDSVSKRVYEIEDSPYSPYRKMYTRLVRIKRND